MKEEEEEEEEEEEGEEDMQVSGKQAKHNPESCTGVLVLPQNTPA